jgi:hypothetical protein
MITWSFFNPGAEFNPVDEAEISDLPYYKTLFESNV